MALFRTAFNDLIPHQFRSFLVSKLEAFFNTQPNNQISLKMSEYWVRQYKDNQLFLAVREYLTSKITRTYKSVRVYKAQNEKHLNFSVDINKEVVDEFEGTKFTWKLNQLRGANYAHLDRQAYVLTFEERNREKVMDRYIPHVLKTYEAMKSENRIPRVHSWRRHRWIDRKFSHPATFDTLALDSELKQSVVDDLERFLKGKEYYNKVGKPWKRAYLLYGPPGTGKSSFIAAIANYLKYDVYDLDLSSVLSDSELMSSLRNVSDTSILVVEDIHCNKEVIIRKRPENLYGSDSEDDPNAEVIATFTPASLLNYMDGLRSGGEAGWLVIFTTNRREKIDPELLRPGRMDMHIHLSFLRGKEFPVLASNYLGIEGHHPLVEEIQGLLDKTQVSHAIVGELLLRNEDPDLALEALVQFLKQQLN